MANSSVYFPPDVLEELDKVAKRKKVSRNRIILEACKRFLEATSSSWPPDFFAPLPEVEQKELEAAVIELNEAITTSRINRKGPPF